MKTLRRIHLYLGCLIAPLIVYFSLSGAWQLFRLNDIPKDAPPTPLHSILHELSKPHTNSTLPGWNPKLEHSTAFAWMALLMGLVMVATTLIGIILALRDRRSRWIAVLCMGLGVVLPIGLLFLRFGQSG